MARTPTKEHSPYATIDDVRTIIPSISDYLKPHFRDEDEARAYIKRCLRLSNIWINNQLKESEMNTFARSNEKNLVEANYAIFLMLRGTLRGQRAEQNEWLFSFKDDAESLLKNIMDKAATRPGLSSKTKRFTKKRFFFPDYGEDLGFTSPHSHRKIGD